MADIRRVTEADVDALLPLKAMVHALHVAERPDFFVGMTREALAGWLRERLADERTHAWLAADGGRPLGYLLAARRERTATPYSLARQTLEIDEVAVDPGSRRRGIGRALVEHAIAEAGRSGLQAVELTTWAFNGPAQAFFARAGFRPMVVRHERRTHPKA